MDDEYWQRIDKRMEQQKPFILTVDERNRIEVQELESLQDKEED